MGKRQIVYISLDEIQPYEQNPRKNDQAVEAVSNSIEKFGFNVPIIVDKDKTIIAGHTRFKAAKKLGLSVVPTIVADDLSPRQAKAYRIADNKVGEISTWDSELLDFELSDLSDFSMTDFGFEGMMQGLEQSFSAEVGVDSRADIPETERRKMEGETYYGDERERTFNGYNLYHFNENACCGKFDMPIIYAENHVCEDFIGFNYALSSDQYKSGIHFFLDDYQFERLWTTPEKYFATLSRFDCCLTPDFSLYLEMPAAMKIWNTYRSRLIGQLLQSNGIKTIPTLSWSDKESFEYCFDGIEPGGTVSVSTIGVKKDTKARLLWEQGMRECLKRVKPSSILVYGGLLDFDFGDTEVIEIKNAVAERWRDSHV